MRIEVEIERLPEALILGYGCFDSNCPKAKELMDSWDELWPERYDLVTPWMLEHVRECAKCSAESLKEFFYRLRTGRPPLRQKTP